MKTGDIVLTVLDCFNVFVAWLCMLLGKCGRGELCDDVINRRVVSLCVCYLLYVYIFFDKRMLVVSLAWISRYICEYR